VPSAVRPTVVLTVSGERPGYLAETLASWSRARGVEHWRFGFHVEPGSRLDECRSAIAAFSPAATVCVNPGRLGVLTNPHAALSWAFGTGAPFAVLAEEDIVVGDDVLELVADRAAAYAEQPDVLGLCAFSRLPAPQPADVVGTADFSPWVWGTWADRWAATIEPTWFSAARAPSPGAGSGFDYGLVRTAAATGSRFVAPLASRSDNIGEHGGVHALPEDFAATRATTFAFHREPVAYREVAPTP
jgi:hypothetical protein